MAGGAINHVCVLASHPHIADAHGSLQPQQILDFAKQFGRVEHAAVWADPRHLGRVDFLNRWKQTSFTVHPVIRSKTKRYFTARDMRVQANQFARLYVSGERTVVLVTTGEHDSEALALVEDMQREGIRVVLFALEAEGTPLSGAVDMTVQVRSVLKGSFDPASMALTSSSSCSGILDTLERDDPESYNLLFDILGVAGDMIGQVRVMSELRMRIRKTARRLPDIVMATIAILAARRSRRNGNAHASRSIGSALVPRAEIWNELKHYDIPNTAGSRALELLLEEGTLTAIDGNVLTARYSRPSDDPLFDLGETLWSEFVAKRPSEIINRILAAFEIKLTDPSLADDRVDEELEAFLELQLTEDRSRLLALYRRWGLTGDHIAVFEGKIRDLIESTGNTVEISLEDSGPVEIAHPKLAACLPRAANAEEPAAPVPALLRQAS